jgi:glucokinase
MSRRLLAGVDIGGTTVAVRLADEDLRSVARTSVPTVRGEPDRAGEHVRDAIDAACAEAGAILGDIAAVGIGVPGQVDPDAGTVSTAVNLDWEHVHLVEQVEALLGVPCAIDNDVRTGAEGIRAQRLLGDIPDFMYVSVGTGIAAGMVVGDRLLYGAHQLAGELGHLVVAPGGPRCACGQLGCLEAIASGPGVAAIARRAVTGGAPSLLPASGEFTAAEVYAAAASGDGVAEHAVRVGADAIAWALHAVGVLIDIPVVTFGGGVTTAGPAFFEPLEQALDRVRSTSALAAAVLPRDLVRPLPAGYEAGTWGAVLLARKGRVPSGARATPREGVGDRSMHR